MTYKRCQFVKSVVFSRSPYTCIDMADAPDYELRGEGPHVRITRGGTVCIVPWSNIAAVELMPEPVSVVTQRRGR